MKEYYINPLGSKEKIGPIAEEPLLQLLRSGAYPPESLVWCDGMAAWTPANALWDALGAGTTPAEAPPIPEAPAPHIQQPLQGPPVVYQQQVLPVQVRVVQKIAKPNVPCPGTCRVSTTFSLLLSIFLCNLPAFILSIVAKSFGRKTKRYWSMWDFATAERKSKVAGILALLAWILIVLEVVIYATAMITDNHHGHF